MTVHVLHAGNGYTYLTRSVAACDARLGRSEALADYYVAKGQPPGRWAGRGAATHDGKMIDAASVRMARTILDRVQP